MGNRPRVKTFGDVLDEYKVHPEPKSAGRDGRTCGIATRGLLERVPVNAENVAYIGKESNRLEEREIGLLHAREDFLTEYGQVKDPWDEVLRILRELPVRYLMEATRLSRRTIQRIRNRGVRPHPRHRGILVRVANEMSGGPPLTG